MVGSHQALQILDLEDNGARRFGPVLQGSLPELQLRGEESGCDCDDCHRSLRVAGALSASTHGSGSGFSSVPTGVSRSALFHWSRHLASVNIDGYRTSAVDATVIESAEVENPP